MFIGGGEWLRRLAVVRGDGARSSSRRAFDAVATLPTIIPGPVDSMGDGRQFGRNEQRSRGQAAVGFEPTNHGFAIRSLSPLVHAADAPVARTGRALVLYHPMLGRSSNGVA